MKQKLGRFLLAIAVLSLTGCGALHVNKTVGLPGLSPLDVNKVVVIEDWKDVARPYQVVGKGTIYRNAGGVPKGGATKQLRAMAADMGADGVIGLHGTTSFRSALMVKWLEPGESNRPVTQPFVVGLLRTEKGPNAREKKLEEEYLMMLVITLEPKGYYLLPNYASGFSGGMKEAMKLDSAALRAVGGPECQFLLEIDYADRSTLDLLVYVEDRTTVQARMLDKATGRIAYEGTGKGAVIGPFDRRIKADAQGLQKALENLRVISP